MVSMKFQYICNSFSPSLEPASSEFTSEEEEEDFPTSIIDEEEALEEG